MRFMMTTTTEDETLHAIMEEIADRVVETVKEDGEITLDIQNHPEDTRHGFTARLKTSHEEIRVVSVDEDAQEAAASEPTTRGD